ncbi:HpcH/HpaI aldolase/citrate lyase family protein [Anaeromonas frigoriresistens]|uniref:HpcH/HpaI aldolase/citrate lyase family protein n=1 Tax=Anaeromonas frigoriresistens TaxID=2683708 RepID=UPI002078B845|nr:HpcH/HpaI aldolase/citrate lyase family protein [Anaeromonas frigoriresistens]
MRYFDFLSDEDRKKIFIHEPQQIDKDLDKESLQYALGATLYIPATKDYIAEDIISNKIKAKSIVICLEDAIGDSQIELAYEGLTKQLNNIQEAINKEKIQRDKLPLLFIRIRNSDQILNIMKKCKSNLEFIVGFVFPKFSWNNGSDYFEKLKILNNELNRKFYGMPILETEDIINMESRRDSLNKINEILNENKDLVLNIRIGATDFSGIFGIRRGYDVTVYDIHVIRDCITDIINRFGRSNNNFVISGPVWEYFFSGDRVLKPKLRVTPFRKNYGLNGAEIRSKLVDKYIDGLINEVLIDRANGLIGKTIIHPSHIIPVQSLYVVTHEEYTDALSILEKNDGNIGVFKSDYSNKMNEIKPHTNWAKRILKRAKIYGVYNINQDFISLMKIAVRNQI